MQQKPMIILTGPTAVGKSALSVELDRKRTRQNSSHIRRSRMPSSA